MKEQIKVPEKIQLSNEEIANLSDADFKTLVIRILKELIEYGNNIKEEIKGSQDSNQRCGPEGRKKHPTRKE